MIPGRAGAGRVRAMLAALTFALLLGAPVITSAQQPTPAGARPPAPRPPRAPGDTTRDSTKKEIVKWADEDSVMQELGSRAGYSATRYQGEGARLEAGSKSIRLQGSPAAVGRGQTILVGDTVIYNDSTHIVQAFGDTIILRDPSQGSDVVALGRMSYDIERKKGLVSNISTSVESGEKWFVSGEHAAVVSDTTGQGKSAFYARDGSLTSCDLEDPHYHFQSKEIKVVGKNVLVARPAVLYIYDVPVLWLPFVFQDLRHGRRSGMLTPRFGVSELLRNSPTYRRHVENVGYYFALNDYMDASLSLDWRSGARGNSIDPGWVRYNGEWRYRWLDRFISGRLGAAYLNQFDGQTNTSISWSHAQDFSSTRRISTDFNYVTSTTVQRQNTYNPYAVLATIASTMAYSDKLGPFSLQLGGSQRQYPGRKQVDRTFPTMSLSTQPLNLTPWLLWTPSFNATSSQSIDIDQTGQFAFRYVPNGVGGIDSVKVRRNQRTSSLSFDTPLRFFNFALGNSFRVTDAENDFPEQRIIVGVRDTSQRSVRVYAKTFLTTVNWSPSFSLPSLSQSKWNITPSVTIADVDAGSLVRSERTGGNWVTGAKRLQYAVGVSPTFYALLPGLGPVARIRHSITPQISYSYSPQATVSDAFLQALGRTRVGYLGALAQSQVTLRLTQNFEAKMRGSATAPDSGRKVKVLALDFSSLTYDFVRADSTGRGLTTDRFSYQARTDLLPGFSFSSDYSLYQGSVLSDTAVFKPFREHISASFQIGRRSGLVSAIARMFGKVVPGTAPELEHTQPQPEADSTARDLGSMPLAGVDQRLANFTAPNTAGEGWNLTATYTSARSRPAKGGSVIQVTAADICRTQFPNDPLQQQLCISNFEANPTTLPTGDTSVTTAGGPVYQTPPQQAIQTQLSLDLTPHWSASWGTTYDFTRHQFASHAVTLQRDLHDWRAIFSFTQAPNGNFAFSFFIALKAEPDLKFDYDRRSVRGGTGSVF